MLPAVIVRPVIVTPALPVMLKTRPALLPLDAQAAALLRSLSDVTLRNWNGIEVGRLRASAALRSALGAQAAAGAV